MQTSGQAGLWTSKTLPVKCWIARSSAQDELQVKYLSIEIDPSQLSVKAPRIKMLRCGTLSWPPDSNRY